MKIEGYEFWKDRFCNECNKQEEVRELYIGNLGVALCKSCRIKLYGLIEEEFHTKSLK